MSYTAPQYVDTKEQAILALASTIKGEAVTGGDGSVNRALDILADVLAEQDVQVPQTDAGAILALAQYVSGGGGGDFTTAEVSITFNIEADKPVVLPTITIYPPQVPLPPTAGIGEFVETDTTTVILYKGMCEGWYSGSGTVSTSGNVEWDSAGKIFDISGDCTIAIS